MAGTFGIEPLERRDCPATLGVAGSVAQFSEAGGSASFVVSLSQRVAQPVTVGYYVGGTATLAADYRLSVGTAQLGATGTLTFAPGETSKVIAVRPIDDVAREGDESLAFTLMGPRNATLGARTATVTILDNDTYTATIVQQGAATPGQLARFRMQLSSPATRTETFSLSTIDGSALGGRDYRPLARVPLVISAGQTSKDFWVPMLPAATNGSVFFVSTEPATTGFPAVPPLGVLIGANSPPPPSLTISDVALAEGNSGTRERVFTVLMTSPAPQTVTVDYATADGTAKVADDDYVEVTGSLTFAPGEFRKTVAVTVVGDLAAEADETFTIVLSQASGAPVLKATGTGTIVNDEIDVPGFQITVTYDATVTASQKLAFERAAARWSQIIKGDLPGVSDQGTFVDDVLIAASCPAIDGVGNTLGQAGPDAFRPGFRGLPWSGTMEFDAADVASLESDGTFTDVVLHEMGHVLGLGTLWSDFGLLVGEGTANPLYTGANALREYRSIFGVPGAAAVPVENTGGSGTADGHWRESVFRTELMSGYAEPSGTRMPISRITVGQFQDLGYVVNYAAADAYTKPLRFIAAAPTGSAQGTPQVGQRQGLPARSVATPAPGLVASGAATPAGSATTSAFTWAGFLNRSATPRKLPRRA